MMRVKVEIPFHRLQTNTDQAPGDILEVSAEELLRIRAVNINMVSLLEEATEQAVPDTPKKPATRKKKQQ